MVQYKLLYFNIRAKGEIIRQILTIAKQNFEDIRIPFQDWPKVKPTTPFGQLPILYENGKPLAQSYAIYRYLARKYNLAGANPWEEAQVDSLADLWKDFNHEIHPFHLRFIGRGNADLEQLKKDILIPSVKKNFPFFVDAIRSADSGYLVGKGLTWVDLMVAEDISFYSFAGPEVLEGFPELKNHGEKIRSNPELQKWLEIHPIVPIKVKNK